MRPTQCVGGLYLTVADSLAPLPINNHKKNFSGDLQLRKTKKVYANFSQGFWRFPKQFQRYKNECCPRAEDRTIFEDLKLRGQGLDLRGQGHQNVSSRPKMFSKTSPLTMAMSNFKCNICGEKDNGKQSVRQCGNCLHWRYTQCTKLSKSLILFYRKSGEPYFCRACLNSIFLFQFVLTLS